MTTKKEDLRRSNPSLRARFRQAFGVSADAAIEDIENALKEEDQEQKPKDQPSEQ